MTSHSPGSVADPRKSRAGWRIAFAAPKRAGVSTTNQWVTACRPPDGSLGVPLFWMKYRRANGSFAGAMVVESTALVIARMQATVFGLDEGLDFISGYEVGAASGEQIPASMIDRLLDERDLRRLH